MRYVLAVLAPPFALLVCGKPVQFVINLVFWVASFPLILLGVGFFVWLFCMFHALIVCGVCERNRQMDRLVNAIQSRGAAASPAAGAEAGTR